MSKTLTEQVRVNLTADEKRALEQHAQREQRSSAWIVRRALLVYLANGDTADGT